MAAKKLKVKEEAKSGAMEYLKKAEDNYTQMLSALENSNYNAVGTLAIQCAISSADAICVYEKGIRSISQDHFDVCELVRSITMIDAKEKSNALKRIIAKKNLIQYEKRSMYQTEAIEIVKTATRFYQWVASHLKG
ncbi:MAG: HEPN domain-containing protein [Candidatus Omnitrophota bacterium]